MRPMGIVILDTNALKSVEHPNDLARIQRSLRAAHLELGPTALNAIEVIKNENPVTRQRLLGVLARVADGRPLLPMVFDMMRTVAAGMVAGKSHTLLDFSKLEWLIYEPERVTPEHVRLAHDYTRQLQAPWDIGHENARAHIRGRVKESATVEPWGDIPSFLQHQWMRVEQLNGFIDRIWALLGLPDKPPYEELLRDDTWRLYFEGIGATIYERAAMKETPRRVHVPDVMLLSYLGGFYPRVIVTEDVGLQRVARAVLDRRYPGARVLTPVQLRELAA
jgi:hypothetical protein